MASRPYGIAWLLCVATAWAAVDVTEFEWLLQASTTVAPSTTQMNEFSGAFSTYLRTTVPQAAAVSTFSTPSGVTLTVTALFASTGTATTTVRDTLAALTGPLGAASRTALDTALISSATTLMALQNPAVQRVTLVMRARTSDTLGAQRCSRTDLGGYMSALQFSHSSTPTQLTTDVCSASGVATCPDSVVTVAATSSTALVSITGIQALNVTASILGAARGGTISGVATATLISPFGDSALVYTVNGERNRIVTSLTCNSSDFIWLVSFVILVPIGYILLQRAAHHGKKKGESLERAEAAAIYATDGTTSPAVPSAEQPPMSMAEIMRAIQALQPNESHSDDTGGSTRLSTTRRTVG